MQLLETLNHCAAPRAAGGADASQAWARARLLGAIDLNSAEPKERHLLRRWRCFSSDFAWNLSQIHLTVPSQCMYSRLTLTVSAFGCALGPTSNSQ